MGANARPTPGSLVPGSKEYKRYHAWLWRQRHPEKSRAQAKQYYQQHSEEKRTYWKRYRATHPAKIAADMLRWQRSNRDHCHKYAAKWRRQNPDTVRRYAREKYQRGISKHAALIRRARKAGASGHHSLQQWIARIDVHGWRCVYCKRLLSLRTVTKDHSIPLVRGGTEWASNLVPACGSCNSRKHTKKPSEFKAVQ